MLLLYGLRGNYCFKNIKLLLIVYSSFSNLSPQVNIVQERLWIFMDCHLFIIYRKGDRSSVVNKIHKLSPTMFLKPFSS